VGWMVTSSSRVRTPRKPLRRRIKIPSFIIYRKWRRSDSQLDWYVGGLSNPQLIVASSATSSSWQCWELSVKEEEEKLRISHIRA
jgi:hypothetical protein